MSKTKQEIITILSERADKLWDNREIDRYALLIGLIKEIKEDIITDYKYLGDVGLTLRCEPTHNRLIEELEDGRKKITHHKGEETWITYEDYNGHY